MPRHLTSCLTLLLLLAGHAFLAADTPPAAVPLRVAVLADLDSLPFHVAQAEGFFAAAHVTVELIPVAAAAERDQLLLADRVDGAVADPIALALANRDGLRLVGIRHSLQPAAGRPQFRLLAAPGRGGTSPADLRGVAVAVSEGTIADYVARRLLEAAGVPPSEVRVTAVPSLAARMALLVDGKVAAAVLPEPLASLAVSRGAVPLADTIDQRPFCCTVLVVRKPVFAARRDELRRLLDALNHAGTAIAADEPRWRAFAVERGLLPEPLRERFTLFRYPAADTLPPRALYDDMAAWLRAAGRLPVTAAYEEVFRTP